MAHDQEAHQNSARIIDWLLEHRTEFEQGGVEEPDLVKAVGLSETEVREAIDHLENHEQVARLPEALSNPPKFLLKPARGWSEVVQTNTGEQHATGKV